MHKYRGIKFISPAELHTRRGCEIMQQRRTVYAAAKAKHPERWSGNTRHWELPHSVFFNPEKEKTALTETG